MEGVLRQQLKEWETVSRNGALQVGWDEMVDLLNNERCLGFFLKGLTGDFKQGYDTFILTFFNRLAF